MNKSTLSFPKLPSSALLLAPVLLAAAVGMAYFISKSGESMGMLIAGALVGLVLVLVSFFNIKFGFYSGIFLGFFAPIFERGVKDAISLNPLAIIIIYVAFAGLVYRKHLDGEPFFKGMAHPINYIFLTYFVFLMVEMFNPESFSVSGLTFYFITTIHLFLLYLLAQHLFQTPKTIQSYLYLWIIASGLCGAYACYQQWVGFFPFEWDWIHLSPKRVDIYQLDNGSLRKFGTLTDPAAFGILMAVSALLTIVVLLKMPLKRSKIPLLIALFFQVMGMTYSGTRTATFALIAGLCLYILMTINNMKTMLFAVFFMLVLGFILYAPIYGNVTINRLRSTFKFSDDASFNVRDINRARVQPYIWSHPIGGGPLTTGSNGEKFVPNHRLAGFPTDSGMLKTALEFGWIGLLLVCALYFIVLQQGAHYFYRNKDPLLKAMLLACVIALFGNIVSQYSQVAVGASPQIFVYYSLIAIIINVSKIENKKSLNV